MIKAEKQYGQSFLYDKEILTKTTQAAPEDVRKIIETKPDLGDLAQELLRTSPAKAYKIDVGLIGFLGDRFQKELEEEKFILLHQGVSELSCFNGDKYFLVANLPHYVVSRLILQALEDENCQGLIVMVQKEMALKLCAKSGSSGFDTLGVLGAIVCEREMLFDVSPSCFNPPPKVVLSVMRLIKQGELRQIYGFNSFKSFSRVCFKFLRRRSLSNLEAEECELLGLFEDSGPKENVRPRELCVNSYLKIYEKLKDQYE